MTEQAAYEHNGHLVAREAFYAIACNPRRSVAVEACAGAGKTWMLVSRMLRALLEGCEPHEILAITFTKKAAGEMRQRLQEWMEDFATRDVASLEQELAWRGVAPADAPAQAVRLQGLHQRLLAGGRPVQIRTFHSWFAALLGTAPVALLQERGLPARYELLEDDAEAVAQVWQPFWQTVAVDATLRADYEAVVARHGRSQTHKALTAALAKRVEFALADEQGVVDASVPPASALAPEFAGLDAPVQVLADERIRSRWLGWAKALGMEALKTPQKAGDAIVDALACEVLDECLARLRKALFVKDADRLSKNLEKYPAAQEAEAELQRLVLAMRQHEAWQHQQRMARLVRQLVTTFAEVKRQHGWVDMNDVERTALVMLSDPVLSGWVQERLDARVRHLLVDEFQDTNPLQWQALHAWLAGYVGAGGGLAPSVFIVGDPKQSIYRFRRAEPQVFLAAQAFVRQGLGGDLLSCDHTRRNAQGVIEAVNGAMDQAQQQREVAGFRSHTTESKDEGVLLRLPAITDDGVEEEAAQPDAAPRDEAGADMPADEVHTPAGLPWRDSLTEPRHEAEESLRVRECAQAARWIAAQIAAGVPANEVMVMARKRDRLSQLQEALRALHIPCVQPEKADLYDAPEVQDVVALVDALVSPGHDLSLARALKSPLFGWSDADLAALALLRRQPEHAGISWFDLLQKEELLAQHQSAVGPVLMQYQAWMASLPPHDALHAIYHHADVLARFAAAAPAPQRAAVVANLQALLSAALQVDGGRYLTGYGLVRAMKQGGMRAPGRADDAAVRLLTVHGAKGLEADCVLLLDTDAGAQKAETMGVLVQWPGESEVPTAFVFMASESQPPPSAANVLDQERQARQREELNMLYVAMTRARHCLALSAVQARKRNEGSWWNRLEPWLADAPVDVQAHGADRADVDRVRVPALPVCTWQAPARPAGGDGAVAPAADVSTPASRMGEAMHQLLEQAGVAGAPLAQLRTEGWHAARLARLALDHDLPIDLACQAAMLAQRILAGEGAWAWDPNNMDQAVNEAPLRYQGHSLRIDRLVHRTAPAALAGWWVLDYKSAAVPERQPALQAQLALYREAVRAVYPGAAVQAAFLTGDGRLVLADAAPATPVVHTPAPAKSARAAESDPASVPQQGRLF